MEKPSISRRSPLSPTLWPTDAFSPVRCLIFIAGIVAAFAVGLVCAALAVRLLGTGPLRSGSTLTLTSGLLVAQFMAYIPLLLTAVPLLPYAARRSIVAIGLRAPHFNEILAGAIGAIVMYVIVEIAAQAQRVAFHLEGKQEAVQLFGTTNDRTLIGGLILLAVVVAPIVEEIIFRGFLFNAFLRYVPVGFAAIASGILFGLAHGDRTAFFPLACGGVVLAGVYYRTGSLVSSMLTHGTFNALNVVLVLVTGGKG